MKKSTLLIFFIALFFAGCAQLSQSTFKQSLENTYNSSSDRLFDIALAVLKSEGFSVAFADKQRGFIQTTSTSIDKQTALALFDKTLEACNSKTFSVRLTIVPLSNDSSQLIIKVISDEKSNGILEQTLLNNVAAQLGGSDMPESVSIDTTNAPLVSVSLKDNSIFEGYLLDDSQRAYLRLKLKSGGILHIERSDIERYTLTSETFSAHEKN
jgi:PBP1b-binding outer membrane lipoprotein LpoB